MPLFPAAFTIDEATRRTGQRVKLMRELQERLLGETGTVIGHEPYRDGWSLVIEWDIGFGSGRRRYDLFSADDFDKYLREV